MKPKIPNPKSKILSQEEVKFGVEWNPISEKDVLFNKAIA